MKAVVIGAKGMLGNALCQKLKSLGTIDLHALDLEELDITKAETLSLDCFTNAKVIFNCAAYTNVDGAESNRNAAFAINEKGVKNLAVRASETSSLLVHFSTDFVFDGDSANPIPPNAPCAPLSVYGQSKLAGEKKLEQSNCRFLIIRSAWMFGQGGKNFVNAILRKAKKGEKLRVVCDQVGAPTYAFDLAEAAIELWQKQTTGLLHCTNSSQASWYQFACEIIRLCGLQIEIKPVTTEEYPTPARRPAYSVLDLSETEKQLGRKMRPWQQALAEYLEIVQPQCKFLSSEI